MAKVKGGYDFEGRIGDLVFYRTQDGLLVRGKGTLNKHRFRHDPVFARARENSLEFGNAARDGKLFRLAASYLGHDIFDNRLTPRINQLMIRVKDFDTTSKRGNRRAVNGLAYAAAKDLVRGFNFNKYAILNRILIPSPVVDMETGAMTIAGFVPKKQLNYPKAATHVALQSGIAMVNFKSRKTALAASPVVNLAINKVATDVVLVPVTIPDPGGSRFFLLKVLFFQEVNGIQYLLDDKAFNGMGVVEVG